MNQLPPEVLTNFEEGDFVVKRNNRLFNQVSPDQSLECLNATGKSTGGIVGITRSTVALSRWALSFNLRSQIRISTREIFGIGLDDSTAHNESMPSRIRRDQEDENKILQILVGFNVFSVEDNKMLYNIATKDIASDFVVNSLLHANSLGQKHLEDFIKQRLIHTDNDDTASTPFHHPLHKNKSATFLSLYKIKQSPKTNKEKVIVADRCLLQKLIVAYKAGRKVNLSVILQHELLPMPVSLANTDGTLQSGQKSIITDVLTKDVI